jgi:hypothetical protein
MDETADAGIPNSEGIDVLRAPGSLGLKQDVARFSRWARGQESSPRGSQDEQVGHASYRTLRPGSNPVVRDDGGNGRSQG